VFSAYQPTQADLQIEMELVKQSWKAALDVAQANGIRVELVTTVLPGTNDSQAIPAFARRLTDLSWLAQGPYPDTVFPAVGEIFSRGVSEGKCTWLLYTNADIGVDAHFYVNVARLVRKDPRKSASLATALDGALKFLARCTERRQTTVDVKKWSRLCHADARLVFQNEGGIASLFPTLELAEMLEVGKPALVADMAGKAAAMDALPPLALTITRLDLINVQLNSTSLQELVRWPRTGRHPGNDCFLVRRDSVPSEVLGLVHPVGFRPWGAFVQDALAHSSHYRRLGSTPQRRLTWHVGKGKFGKDADDWKGHAARNPLWVLFAASNWFALTKGRFAEKFSDNELCSFAVQRVPLCMNVPVSSWCVGTFALSCAGQIRSDSRDYLIYTSICRNRGRAQPAPGCAFCRFLLKDSTPCADDGALMQPFCSAHANACRY